MSKELLLKDYLFRFLRSPDYITDVNYYLPKFLAKDPAFAETQRVLSWEHERYRLKIIDFAQQFHPQTATWGLDVWEEELGLSKDLSLDLELRRAKVMAKLLGASPMTVAKTNQLVNLFTDDGEAYVDELPEDGTIQIIIPSKQVYLDEMRDSLDEMLPAHLVYYFQRIIVIGDDDDEENEPDRLDDINDYDSEEKTALFISTDFPIVENVPYGKWYNAPKYDGSVRVEGCDSFIGNLRYDGIKSYIGLNSDTARFGEFCKWWFVPTGNSLYDKEFQNNGAIRYDGLRPQEIEYDDGMDELKIIELTNAIEEKVSSLRQFNGSATFNGGLTADEEELPTDRGGSLSITRFKYFDGKTAYDGGDINYFNGAIKADGVFNFTGDGTRARTETLTDDIHGDLSYSRLPKDTPLNFYYPEIFDFVPKTLDEHIIEISEAAVSEAVDPVTDDCSALTIYKAVRYNGSKDYGGGNLNCFNGGIKADGKFDFAGGGNQAKIEVIAVDLDGSFSMQHIKKNTPPVYIENIDFVSRVYDETLITARTYFEDSAVTSDGNGELIIRRRSRYDGNLSYRGVFEYPANATKHFDGDLNYNGVYRLNADSTARFNGVERYGGRKNYSVIEYVTDLNGNTKIVDTGDLERIPIATRQKLGFVIAGNNLEIDDRGKITLPDRFKTRPMFEMDSGALRVLFENRRQ